MKELVFTLILGTATPGGGFPVYGDAFAEMVNAQEPQLLIQPRNTKGSTENVPLLEGSKVDLALVAGEIATAALAKPGTSLRILGKQSSLQAVTLPARSYGGQDAPLPSVGSWSFVLAKPDLPEEVAYLLARAIHRAESPLAARLEQARETTMENTVTAAPRAD